MAIILRLDRVMADRKISLNELAEHKYFVSAGHLSRLFKAKTGMNFSKYLTNAFTNH